VGWLFVAPAVVAYALFVLWPMGLTIQYSLYDWNGVGASTWVGLDNYEQVFTDPKLFDTILHAFELILYFSVVPVLLGLAIANTIRSVARTRLALVARTIIFVPTGDPAGRGRNHVELAARLRRPGQPDPVRGGTRWRHQGVAR
jgi:raffinose/stachyose/melibiose transport system permease protein